MPSNSDQIVSAPPFTIVAHNPITHLIEAPSLATNLPADISGQVNTVLTVSINKILQVVPIAMISLLVSSFTH